MAPGHSRTGVWNRLRRIAFRANRLRGWRPAILELACQPLLPWYVPAALSGRRTMSCTVVAGVAASVVLSACGGGQRQDVSEPSGTFHVQVTTASFPTSQRLSQHTHLVIAVRNTGNK